MHNIEGILKLWEERVRREIKAAPAQMSLALRNSLPEYLTKLATSLSTSVDLYANVSPLDFQSANLPGVRHGRERAESHNYTIDQLISEYHILRQTIFEFLETEITLSIRERNIIIDSIEQAVNDAATEFSNHLKDIQETLSRTLIHDLRSPLGTAMLLAEMIESTPETSVHNQKIQGQLSSSFKRIGSMLCHLMDYSSIKAGQGLKLHCEQLDMCGLIRNITDEYNISGSNRIIFNAPLSVVGFWDVRGITSILENLVTNALKYSDPKTPIEISIESRNEWIKIIIHNEGKVIPAEEQSRLFEKFHRAKNATTESGWGLGLSIVKSIAESHGGHVGVKSLVDLGTSFVVELPIDCRTNIAV